MIVVFECQLSRIKEMSLIKLNITTNQKSNKPLKDFVPF